jgi:hypothetical protein
MVGGGISLGSFGHCVEFRVSIAVRILKAHSLGHFWQLRWSYAQLPLARGGGTAPAHIYYTRFSLLLAFWGTVGNSKLATRREPPRARDGPRR